jgi:predicted Zn finger-like uncharacterized protein
MEKTQITQCPKCDTTFRVTPAQLAIARGAVRCGACLHVFRASDYFQKEKEDTSSKDDRTQDMFSKQLFEKPADKDGFGDAFNELDTDSDLIHDDMEGESGLIHDDMFDEQVKSSSVEISDDFMSINLDDTEDPFFNDLNDLAEVQAAARGTAKDDESWAQDLLNDSEDEAAPKPKFSKQVTPKVAKQTFSYIEVDPLDLSLPERPSRGKFWLWAFACLSLVMSLTAQLSYFNFEQWARQESMRPWYQLVCEQLDCILPSTYDLTKIQTTASPQVSSHPKYQNALTVDVLFINHASYKQAFPKLELTFTDFNDKPVAHRLFAPAEYLAGEASGLKLMPVETPIHIALEIQDPGSRANNYSVRFLAP